MYLEMKNCSHSWYFNLSVGRPKCR